MLQGNIQNFSTSSYIDSIKYLPTENNVMVHPKTVRVVGVGMTRLGKLGRTSSSLMQEALQGAKMRRSVTGDCIHRHSKRACALQLLFLQ